MSLASAVSLSLGALAFVFGFCGWHMLRRTPEVYDSPRAAAIFLLLIGAMNLFWLAATAALWME